MVRCEICSIEHNLGPINLNGQGKRLLISSFPKAGTNYLIQFLGGRVGHISISHEIMYMGMGIDPHEEGDVAGSNLTLKSMVDQLSSFGGSAFGHIPFNYSFLVAIQSKPTTMFIMVRDPKDVIASHYHYVMDKPHVAMNYRFRDRGIWLSDTEDPVLELIKLSPARWRTFLPWIENGAHPVRFEDLRKNEAGVCQNIIDLVGPDDHINLGLPDPRVMMNRVQPGKSPTFRQGEIGDWSALFKEHHIEAYEKVGMLEIEKELGYGST